jgi:hypothetical protein
VRFSSETHAQEQQQQWSSLSHWTALLSRRENVGLRIPRSVFMDVFIHNKHRHYRIIAGSKHVQ